MQIPALRERNFELADHNYDPLGNYPSENNPQGGYQSGGYPPTGFPTDTPPQAGSPQGGQNPYPTAAQTPHNPPPPGYGSPSQPSQVGSFYAQQQPPMPQPPMPQPSQQPQGGLGNAGPWDAQAVGGYAGPQSQPQPTQPAKVSPLRFVVPPPYTVKPGELSIEAAIRFGFRTARNNGGFWFGFTVIYLFAAAVIWGIQTAISVATFSIEDLFREPTAVDYIQQFLNMWLWLFLSMVVSIVFLHNALKEIQGDKATFGTMFKGIRWNPALLFVVIATTVVAILGMYSQASSVSSPVYGGLGTYGSVYPMESMDDLVGSMLIGIGFSVFIAVIFPLIAFLLAPFIMFTTPLALDGRGGLGECLSKGFVLGKRYYLTLLWYMAIVGFISMIAAIPCGLGLIVTMPSTAISMGYLYRTAAGAIEGRPS